MALDKLLKLSQMVHNTININQTQSGGNNIIQSQSIHINQNMNITGDGNHVTGIHVGVDGDIIDDFNNGRKSVDDVRNAVFYGGSTKKEKYLQRKRYHGILNSDPTDEDSIGSLEDFLHFYETNAYKEGYLLSRKVKGTNIDENFRILPVFMSGKFSRLFPTRNIYSESDKDPILGTGVDRAYNIYYRITDNAVFYIVSKDVPGFKSFCPFRLEMCHLVELRYYRKDNTSAPVFYDPEKDYFYTKDDNTIILSKVTETNFQKFLDLLWAMKFEIFIVILIILIYINFH